MKILKSGCRKEKRQEPTRYQRRFSGRTTTIGFGGLVEGCESNRQPSPSGTRASSHSQLVFTYFGPVDDIGD